MIDREIYIMDLDAIPEVVVSEGFIAGDEEDSTYDLTTVDYELDTGNIVQCDVVLNSVFAYDGATMLQTLIHSLGHCLGLDDDPGPPATVDLQSAMSKPLDPLGEFTQHDIEIIQEMFDSASM
jgi:hypothetical protein